MRKRKTDRVISLLLCLAVFLTGSVLFVRAAGEKSTETNGGEDRPVGGGYAASAQIPGVYYQPVLYDASNGLTTSEANCIMADREGYLWIGSYSGIIKYDGIRFEKMPVEGGLTSGRAFFEDSRGRIWVATNDNGVVVVDGQQQYHFLKSDGLPTNSIRSFAEDDEGNVFVATTDGVAYINSGMQVVPIEDTRLQGKRVLRLVSDVNGKVYGHTTDGEVFSVSEKGLEAFYRCYELGIPRKITTILADPEVPGTLYYGTNGHSIYYGKFEEQAEDMQVINADPIENIHWMEYMCGRLWVSSIHQVGYMDENGSCVLLENLPAKDSFEMMTSDHQGNLWFASSRYGAMKIVADNFLDYTAAAGIEPEVVNATCYKNGYLYIGTDHGLSIVSNDHRRVENYITDYFEQSRIRCIMKDSNGNVWFSTFSGLHGLVRLNSFGTLKDFTVYDDMPSNDIRCTCEAKDGSLIVGTNAGIAVIRGDTVDRTLTSINGVHNTVILTVCEGDNGEIYAGTDGDGIYVFKDGTCSRIGMEDGLGSDVIVRLKNDERRGVMWVLTSSTVAYIKDGEIRRINTFPNSNIYDVVECGGEELWFLSSQGIYAIHSDAVMNDAIEQYRLYDSSNGLSGIPVSYCYNDISNGILYIAEQNGVSAVAVDNYYDLSGTERITVRSISCDGEECYPDETGQYRIPAESRRIQITPGILDYTVTDPLVHVYLEGAGDEGITARQSSLTSLIYTGLNYGDYSLRIQILDEGTKEVLREKSFRLVKEPQFFERVAVKLLFMLLALLVIGIIVWRTATNSIIRKQYIEIQEAKTAAENANKAKSIFLANISHEIRTPINTIVGMNEMILRENSQKDPQEYQRSVNAYAGNIKYASESLLGMINDLLDISQIESGKLRLTEQEYDTEDMLCGIVSLVRRYVDDKKLYFELDIDEMLPRKLYGDNGKLRQIVLNLLSNAVKFTEEGGIRLQIRVTEKNEAEAALRIAVKDSGIGVKNEDMEKLFHAYERLDEVKNSGMHGTGLGLDISRQLAELMGGKLWCESVYGEGSEFLLTIKQKIADDTPIGVFREEILEQARGAYKPQFMAPDADILVADDDKRRINVIRGLLKPNGIFVTTATSGEECLNKIEDNDFNLVLLDQDLPGMNGNDLIEMIREKHPELPVYILTDSVTADGEEYYRSQGYNGYLLKPVDIRVLEHTIMMHLPERMMNRLSGEEEQ